MRAFDRDLICGEHYGQRPWSAASTGRTHGCTNQPRITIKENPCQQGAVHTWHKADIAVTASMLNILFVNFGQR
jgi:hypothetical protein